MVTFVSAYILACAFIVALLIWAKIERNSAILTPQSAASAFRHEFPDQKISAVWVSSNGQVAMTRSFDQALLLFYVRDGLVMRSIPFGDLVECERRGNHITIPLDGKRRWGARLTFAASEWPPAELRA